MRLYLDENVDRDLANNLRKQGHDVYEVTADPEAAGQGISDEEHVRRATKDDRILIAEDRDHSEVRHRDGIGGCGVLYSRSEIVTSSDYASRVAKALEKHQSDLEAGRFITIGNNGIRISQEIEQKQEPTRQQSRTPPSVDQKHAREELTPARTEQIKQEANRRANETMAERWQRERAERARQPENLEDRGQGKQRSQVQPETSAKPKEKDQAARQGQDRERQPGQETMAEKWKREQASRQQQDTGSCAAQVQEGQQREREHDR